MTLTEAKKRFREAKACGLTRTTLGWTRRWYLGSNNWCEITLSNYEVLYLSLSVHFLVDYKFRSVVRRHEGR